MTDANTRAVSGDNNPPSPMEACASLHDATISEAGNWSDGELVENEAQMAAVELLIKGIKSYRSDLKKAGEEVTKPLTDAHKAGVASVKVWTVDADALQACLISAITPYKTKVAAKKTAAAQALWAETERKRIAASELEAAAAFSSDIEVLRRAQAAKADALAAENASKAATKDKPKGFRTVQHHAVEDMRALVNWIATNDKAAMAEFATEYARRNHADIPDTVVRSWSEKVVA